MSKASSPPKAFIKANLIAYTWECGACGHTWDEIWGDADDITGMDPYSGMDVQCPKCDAELELEMEDV